MSTDLHTILTLPSVDLSAFEIRGSKAGANNARTTGLVYVDGNYSPSSNIIDGTGFFTQDSSVVSSISFNVPYASFTALNLKVNDTLFTDATYTISRIDSSSIIEMDRTTGLNGSYPVRFTLGQREYLVEPDIFNNEVKQGTADFSNGVDLVFGWGTNWISELSIGDVIKHDGYQVSYKIATVLNNNLLQLDSDYAGDTTTGPYTANKVIIGREKVQYVKDDFYYDKNGGYWRYDATTGSNIPTSIGNSPLAHGDNTADGLVLKYSKASSSTAPDLSETALVFNKVFAQSTTYDALQFPLPAVPYPEDTFTLYVNNIKKDRYPVGNQFYIISYSQNPVYTPPPPPTSRYVANLMFLKRVQNIYPSTSATENGILQFIDSSGNSLTDVLGGSESINLDGTSQTAYKDYVIEPNSGIATITDSTVDEPLVRYIGADLGPYIDYGFAVYLDGVRQKISFPAKNTDDVVFQTATGRFKPTHKSYPGYNELYEIHYQVEGASIDSESSVVATGQTLVQARNYPIKRDTLIVSKNGEVLEENTDYHASYLTGSVNFFSALDSTDALSFSYTPLSLQVNGLSRSDGTSYCTTYDSRLIIKDSQTLTFSILNPNLSTESISVLRVFNETRDSDYNLGGLTKTGSDITLQLDSTNSVIGCLPSDTVLIDYKFASTKTEYSPAYINNFVVSSGSDTVYFEGQNIVPLFSQNSILRLGDQGSSAEYFFIIDSSVFTGIDTKIILKTSSPVDLVNPATSISEPVTFLTIPAAASPITAGSPTVSFPDINIKNLFRTNTLIRIQDDVYNLLSAEYDISQRVTNLTLSTETLTDYTSNLSSLQYSDLPVYVEGATELFPRQPIVTTASQPGFIITTTDENRIFSLSSDTSNLYIDSSAYSYGSITNLGDLSSTISSDFRDLDVTTYVPGWSSNKIIPVSQSIYFGSISVLSVQATLRIDNTDSTGFSVTDGGSILLDQGIIKGQVYDIDYMGQRYLGGHQAGFSVTYFTSLPAKSKIAASFQFRNLDQFYIQVLSERDFLGNVTIPRIEQETASLSDNVGQGGDVATDENEGNSEGGLVSTEYQRQDAEIETRIFKNIYDFFGDRLVAYGQEMQAATGLTLFNNDGTFSEIEQGAATKSLNRIFPTADYTNQEPFKANPLTGEFTDTGAIFHKNRTDVTGIGSYWSYQLPVDMTSYIGRADSTRRYRVNNVVDDNHLVLTTTFKENSTTKSAGDKYVGSIAYPVYDDDGYMGPKIVGSKNSLFGINDSDVFNVILDGTGRDYTFTTLPGLMGIFFPLSKLNGEQVASILSDITGLSADIEQVLDPTTIYGYRDALVLRTMDFTNCMTLGDGSAVSKLGFIPGTQACGNWDRTGKGPETILCLEEAVFLDREKLVLQDIYNDGTSNKLNRIDSSNYDRAVTVSLLDSSQMNIIALEQPKISTEIAALNWILRETSTSPYDSTANTVDALSRANQMLSDNSAALVYDSSIYPNWGLDTTSWKWVLDFKERTQYIRGKDTVSGIGVDTPSGLNVVPINGQTQFRLNSISYNDLRVLNTTIDGTSFSPALYYEDNNALISGAWSGWNPVIGNVYSYNNQITFSLSSVPLFRVRATGPITSVTYSVDTTGLTLNWMFGVIPNSQLFDYNIYYTVGLMKFGINVTGIFDATGYNGYNLISSKSYVLASGSMPPDATVYSALRPCYARYQTISDNNLVDRSGFDSSRANTLINRSNYLASVRESQIASSITRDILLRDQTDTGDLYAWADARFNRRQGCNARLDQLTKMAASNKSALTTNKRIYK